MANKVGKVSQRRMPKARVVARDMSGAYLLKSKKTKKAKRKRSTRSLKFIDLFAGLGGFHRALTMLGHECVFASEINPILSDLYEKNFGLTPAGDIRKVELQRVPRHDILCAGFPCQPFSKAGAQQGLQCPQWGDLIDYVIAILRYRKPEFFIIENVPNLVRHDDGRTWAGIIRRLKLAGYSVEYNLMSPHLFGIPQIRERAFIVGRRGDMTEFKWPTPRKPKKLSIKSVLDKKPAGAKKLPEHFIEYLEVWQELIKKFPADEELPTFPIWAMEFGATYPYEDKTPHARKYKRLGRFRGALGTRLKDLTPKEAKETLPQYARDKTKYFPDWKIEFIRKNREFYRKHKKLIDPWLPKIKSFAPSFQKLEWNVLGGKRRIWDYVLQFRASGIRVKRTTVAPSLIAMTTSQIPVVAWEKRYMTPRECSRLQSMGGLRHLPKLNEASYKALGNAVNVKVVKAITKNLVSLRTSRGRQYK